MKRSKAIARVHALWSTLPKIECQGKCTEACGPIMMTKLEAEILGPVTVDKNLTCSLLDCGRCSKYSSRPTICRLYGIVEGLECPFGCKRETLWTKQQAHDFMKQVEQLSQEAW